MKKEQTGERTRRLVMPPKRALVGGALIALAALGVFGAHRNANSDHGERFVVATRDIAPGTVIKRSDLGAVKLDLPDGISAIGVGDATDLIGRVVSGPIAELELISADDFLPADHFVQPDGVDLAIDLPAARAMEGVVTAGSIVTVLSTDPEGAGTTVLTDAALVSSIQAPSRDSISSAGAVRVVLSVQGQELASSIVDASIRSDLSLVLPSSNGGQR